MVEIEVPHKEVSRIYEGFQKLLNEPSERSAIIVLSARIESLTEKATSHFIPGVRLSGQVRRLDALHGLGVIDDKIHELLKELASIRNYYAHSDDDCTISDSEIATKVKWPPCSTSGMVFLIHSLHSKNWKETCRSSSPLKE